MADPTTLDDKNQDSEDKNDETQAREDENGSGEPESRDDTATKKKTQDFLADLPGDYDPLKDPRVKRRQDELLSKAAAAEKKAEETSKKFEELQAELRGAEKEKAGDVQRKDMEIEDLRKELEEVKEKLAVAEQELQFQTLVQTRAQMASAAGIKSRHHKYLSGDSEEEIRESIEAIKADFPSEYKDEETTTDKGEQEKTDGEGRPASSTGRARRKGSDGSDAETTEFTAEDISQMTPAEYRKHREKILKRSAAGQVKRSA